MKMTKAYNPNQFEDKWQQYWDKEKIYQTPLKPRSDKKIYCLSMFPYPSGAGLHVGHVRIYTGTDVLARYFRMNGYDVLHPMGFDAFGLPAENAAIKAQKNPMDMVPANIANFKKQMQRLGLSYDWDKEFSTTDPEYYANTQWLFLQFFKLGLLYKKQTPVYFCNSCATGLAEEEVLPNGTHERCGKPIIRKMLPQWLFKITDYSDSLLAGLKDLKWPSGILQMQKNWIGKDRGLNIFFVDKETKEPLTVWTRFWETVFGATFLVVSPEHSWVSQGLAQNRFTKEVKTYCEKALQKTNEQRLKDERDKSGVFTGCYAVNPVNGQPVPIWVADYVLANVGTGAVMGVPAHDERDFAFAQKYNLKIVQVVSYPDQEIDKQVKLGQRSHEAEGVLVNSKQFDGLSAWEEGKQKMAKWMVEKNFGQWQINYHLRDWIFSRQRYWGEPIPMVYCSSCAKAKQSYFDTQEYKLELKKIAELNPIVYEATIGRLAKTKENMYGWYPISEKNLPLKLPYLKKYEPSQNGESPLANSGQWLEATCPHCQSSARRETDTMPNWAGSCWYFLRFATGPITPNITPGVIGNTRNITPGVIRNTPGVIYKSPYLPVDWYLGGAEHAVLHLLYARFWMHVLNDIKLIDFREPFLRLKNVGMVLAQDHRKMSKSLGNVINPDEVVEKFGADSLRLYEMFMAPFSQEIAWSTNNLLGAKRFLAKVYQLFTNSARLAKPEKKEDEKLVAKLQTTIKKVSIDITNVKFNTAISALMEFANAWQKSKLSRANAQKYLILLAPFCPFITEEIWQHEYKMENSIHNQPWPIASKVVSKTLQVTLPVTINGKVRALLSLNNQIIDNEKQVLAQVLKNKTASKYLVNKKYRHIYVKGKIINFILK